VELLQTSQIGKNLFLVDLQTGSFNGLIASYVIRGKRTAIVESGPASSIPNLLKGLKELRVKPEEVAYLAISHVHIDHGGGAGTILKSLPNALVIVHPNGIPHLVDPRKLWTQSQSVLGHVAEILGKPEPVPENRIIAAKDGMEVQVGNNLKLQVVETLGHASHHLSYFSPIHEAVFPGDAAGIYLNQFDVVVPTSPPPFRLNMALVSLHRLESLEPKFLCYSHFGQASDAKRHLRDYELRLKLWADVASDGIRRNQSPDVIRERIFSEDATMQKVAGFLRGHPIYSKVVFDNSTDGFIDIAARSVT